MLFDTLSQNYWFDESTGVIGPTFDLFDHRISNWVSSGVEFAGIIWGQGEADTHNVTPENRDAYEQGLSFVLETLSELSQTDNIHIQALGDRAYYNPSLHAGNRMLAPVEFERQQKMKTEGV